MKANYFLVIALLLFCMMSCKSGTSADKEKMTGKATLVFRATKEEVSVRIYKPIDGMYNYAYMTDKLDLKPNISISYELDVNDFSFVKCRFSNGEWGDYLIFPGDNIEITCEPKENIISGSNAEGNKYFNDNYVNRGLGYYDKILRRRFTLPINYDSIYYYFQHDLILPYQTDLKKMETSGSISSKFSSILAKNLFIGMSAYSLLSIYEYSVLDNRSPISRDNYTPSDVDLRNVLLQINKLYETLNAMSGDINKMDFSTAIFYRLKYRYIDDEAKQKLTEGYDKDTFGKTPYFLLASDSLQLGGFGSHLIEDLQNIKSFYNYNQDKLLAYLDKKFPDSEYVAIIKKLMIKTQSAKVDTGIVIINDPISSIKELMQLPCMKGKYAYIDLWATWCEPCMIELQYNDDIHQLLAQYNNIVPFFISIDSDRKIWENEVKKFNVKGYHIMASKSLNEDIGKRVYHAKKVGFIPRYLLVDSEGKIINDNLPRPSKSAQLKPIFASTLK